MKMFLMLALLISQTAFGGNAHFDKTLSGYEKLHQAFFERDIKKVKSSAQMVLKSLDAVTDQEISKTLIYTRKKLAEIGASDNMEESKKAFAIVSQGLLVVLEKQAPNKNYARYYCPMVKRYWIQNVSKSEKVMNPYESGSMPHCGEKK